MTANRRQPKRTGKILRSGATVEYGGPMRDVNLYLRLRNPSECIV
jgi:hypothetical protein